MTWKDFVVILSHDVKKAEIYIEGEGMRTKTTTTQKHKLTSTGKDKEKKKRKSEDKLEKKSSIELDKKLNDFKIERWKNPCIVLDLSKETWSFKDCADKN